MEDKDYEAMYNEKCEVIENLYATNCELIHENQQLEKEIINLKSKIRELERYLYRQNDIYND